MGKIPEFTRSRLASRAVGTPGIDTGAGAGFQAISNISENIRQVAQQRQDVLDLTEINKESIQLEIELEQKRLQHQKFFESDPNNSIQFFQDNATDTINTRLDNIRSGKVRAAVSSAAEAIKGTKLIKLVQWESQQQVVNGFNNILEAHNTSVLAADQAGKDQDLGRFSEILANIFDPENKGGGRLVSSADERNTTSSMLYGSVPYLAPNVFRNFVPTRLIFLNLVCPGPAADPASKFIVLSKPVYPNPT